MNQNIMNLKKRDILHKYWFEDRYAEGMFDITRDVSLQCTSKTEQK